jgi:hypothetical protein
MIDGLSTVYLLGIKDVSFWKLQQISLVASSNKLLRRNLVYFALFLKLSQMPTATPILRMDYATHMIA